MLVTGDAQLWESLWQARQSCEKMSSRGVRAAKDVLHAWSGITGDLVDRVERSEQQVKIGCLSKCGRKRIAMQSWDAHLKGLLTGTQQGS